MEKKRGKLSDEHHAGDETREERLPRKNLEECERSRRTMASMSRASFLLDLLESGEDCDLRQ